MKQKPYLRVVLNEPIRIVIGKTELEHLLMGQAVGFHLDATDIKIEIARETLKDLDPPEARELLSTFRRRT